MLIELPVFRRRWCAQTYRRRNPDLGRWHLGWITRGPARVRVPPGALFEPCGDSQRVGVEIIGPQRCLALYVLEPLPRCSCQGCI